MKYQRIQVWFKIPKNSVVGPKGTETEPLGTENEFLDDYNRI
jgi:hypothetical protein